MIRTIVFAIILILAFGSCTPEKSTGKGIFNFDSLLNEQISALSQRMRVVDKITMMDGVKSDSTFIPSEIGWTRELEVFRQLGSANKPADRSTYTYTDFAKDERSNLVVNRFTSDEAMVRELKFYFIPGEMTLKKIEGFVHDENLLYTTHRFLKMEFVDDGDASVLIAYSADGFQKMIFSDTVWFSIDSKVEW